MHVGGIIGHLSWRTELLPEALIGKRLGNYVVKACIGQGGMGSVYQAEHPRIQRQVAIKVLAPQLAKNSMAVERFEAEARALTRIQHPHIVEVYDLDATDTGQLYYVMELLLGHDLLTVISGREGGMSAQEVRPYVEQICAALQVAHDRGVVHRDIKPANIFVMDGDPLRIKILDFGVAKLLESVPSIHATRTGTVLGTPQCISPEQALGQSNKVGPQSDVYSLGVLLYWMLCGEPPFAGTAPGTLLSQHVRDAPPSLLERTSGVPVAVAGLVHQCLEKNPARRPVSASAVADGYTGALEQADQADPLPHPQVVVHAPDARSADLGPAVNTVVRASGEVARTADLVPRRPVLRWVVLATLTTAVVVAGAVLWSRLGLVPENRAAAGGSVRAASRDAAPPAKETVVHTVEVMVEGPEASCVARIGGGPPRRQTAPCRFRIPSGHRLRLTVRREGFRPINKDWRVKADRAIVVEMTRMPATNMTHHSGGIRPPKPGTPARGRSSTPAARSGHGRPGTPRRSAPARPKVKPPWGQLGEDIVDF